MTNVSNLSPMGPAYRHSRTITIFLRICKMVYISCACNFWFEDLEYPQKWINLYKVIDRVFEVLVILFILSETGSFHTQKNLSEKQSSDLLLFIIAHITIFCVYMSAMYYKKEIRELVFTLTVRLKEVYNDEEIEKMMIKGVIRYLSVLTFVCSCTLLSFGLDSGFQAITSNSTFVTVIPMWPDIDDHSRLAGATRVFSYFVWWLLVIRSISIYLIVLALTVCLRYQFQNLCKYFEDLNFIFDGESTQEEKEKRYEDGFKKGIQMHSLTVWCSNQIQLTGSVAFSAQIVINVSVLVMLMVKMLFLDRNLMALLPIVFMGSSALVGTGLFMWNAGDVTVEASNLPTAMFHSGWHNCQKGASVRVRKLVTIAIAQAQRRVTIRGLGIVELSYESYVQIVKSAYSVFSVIY